MTLDDEEVMAFYAKAKWKIGTLVLSTDGERRGVIVSRGGQQWSTRDKLPLVRWNGKLDAVPVPLADLRRA